MASPSSSPDASEQVARRIRRLVAERRLKPGDRIGTELALAGEFGVSRPTVREALRLLSSSHLIRIGRGRAGGIFVARTASEALRSGLSDSVAAALGARGLSLRKLLDARLAVEPPIAGRAAVRANERTVAALQQAVDAAAGVEPSSVQFREADARFHRVLAEAAGNEALRALTAWTTDVVQPALIDRVGGKLDADAIAAQHRAILRAVRRGQRSAAERAMAVHLEYLIEVLTGA